MYSTNAGRPGIGAGERETLDPLKEHSPPAKVFLTTFPLTYGG